MNPLLLRLGSVVFGAFLSAIGLFLSRILEPVIAWFTFTSIKFLIKVTGSDTLRSMYGQMKDGYEKNQGNMFYGYSPLNTNNS